MHRSHLSQPLSDFSVVAKEKKIDIFLMDAFAQTLLVDSPD